jgi:hypothetical protein
MRAGEPIRRYRRNSRPISLLTGNLARVRVHNVLTRDLRGGDFRHELGITQN